MDTYSTVEVAKELGVPLPRLLRFVSGKDGAMRVGNRIRLSPGLVDMARDRFGVIPKVPGLTRVEVQALVALSRHPRGLVSIRQVAKAARLSPTAASRAVSKLVAKGLVARSPTPVFDGKVETKDVLEVAWLSPSWREVAPILSKAELPKAKTPATLGKRLPPRLADVFWTGDWRRVDPSRSPRYVAQRILDEGRDNPEALAFLGNLPEEAVRSSTKRMAEARLNRPTPRSGRSRPLVHDESKDARLLDRDGFPPGLEQVLDADMRSAWRQVREFLPPGSYLAGGTAVAIHLRHRKSRDLDFFTTVPLDVDELYETLGRSTLLYVARRVSPKAGNIAITLGSTKIEFSDAAMATMVEPTMEVNGIQVAGIGDLLAMKLSTVAKRLRDFEDLRVIEQIGGRRFEEGLALVKRHYNLKDEASAAPIIAAFAMVEECEPDELIITPKEVIVEYFRKRLPEVIASLGRWDDSVLSPELAVRVARLIRDN